MKIYEYPRCSTCKNALAYLDKKKISYLKKDITQTPPSKKELQTMLGHYNGQLKKLFNTSGELYREMKLSEKLTTLSESEALDLLSRHGKLVKRPFVLTESAGVVGFKEDEWKERLKI